MVNVSEPATPYDSPNYLWQCKDGTFIQRVYVCDGVINCADGSDEITCGKFNIKLLFYHNQFIKFFSVLYNYHGFIYSIIKYDKLEPTTINKCFIHFLYFIFGLCPISS